MKKPAWLMIILLNGLIFNGLAQSSAFQFAAAPPESLGLSTTALGQLAQIVEAFVTQNSILGGELLIIKNRKTVLHRVFGWQDRELNSPMTKNSIFNIRSMTKPVTGAAIQILIDQGKLKTEDPVAKYLPGFANEKSKLITIGQLLTHQSGLPLNAAPRFADLEKFPQLRDLANFVGEQGPVFPPGSKFWYSDAGADVLGAIIEIVSGQPLVEFIQENLIAPLGLNDTFFLTQSNPGKDDRIASLYGGTAGNWQKFWKKGDPPFYPYAFGSQSLYATPADYARFLCLWLDGGKYAGKQILSTAAIKRTLVPVQPMKNLGMDTPVATGFPGMDVFYGQMAVLYVPQNATQPAIIGHSGSDGTFAWAWPEKDLIVLYFTQSRGQVTGLRLEKEIDRLLIHPDAQLVAAAIPEKYQPLVGKYRANFGQFRKKLFEITTQNGNLALDIPGQMIFELNPPDSGGRWTFKVLPTASVAFEKSGNSAATALKFFQTDQMLRKSELSETPTEVPGNFVAFLGIYAMPRGQASVKIIWQDQCLNFVVPGQGASALALADEPDRFVIAKAKGAEISFSRDTTGAITALNFYQQFTLLRE